MKLVLSKGIVKELLDYMRSQLPYEAVAFLLGTRNDGWYRSEKIITVKNAALSNVEFTVDPDELYSVYKRAENMKMEIVCIFHTHPGPAFPSSRDAIFMKLNPVPWLIASAFTEEFRAFIMNTGEIYEIKIDVI